MARISNSKRQDMHDTLEAKCLRALDTVLHILTLLLIFALLVGIIKELYTLIFIHLLSDTAKAIIAQILFIVILIELFTVLTAYLRHNQIKVQRVLEIGIIALVRETIFVAFEADVGRLYSIAVLLLVFGIVFAIEKHFAMKRNR